MSVRHASHAGRFYPATKSGCINAINGFKRPSPTHGLSPKGVIVPHAGWVYSGATAWLGWRAAAVAEPETVVLFGAAHRPLATLAVCDAHAGWDTPLGGVAIDCELRHAVNSAFDAVVVSAEPHRAEHSLEVNAPLVRHCLPAAKLLPILVEPQVAAAELGERIAQVVRDLGRRVVFAASTDLTHYGSRFGFEPQGHGELGVRWAFEVNDRRFIDAVAAFDSSAIIAEARSNRNACGAGAVAACVGASRELGAKRLVELEHTSSAAVLRDEPATMSVGYFAGALAP